MAGLPSSNAMKASFRKVIVIFVSVLVVFSIAMHFWNKKQNKTEDKEMLAKEYLTSPMTASYNSMIRNSKMDIKIDGERRALRKIEQFNLMEESYGANWEKTYLAQSTLTNCTIG